MAVRKLQGIVVGIRLVLVYVTKPRYTMRKDTPAHRPDTAPTTNFIGEGQFRARKYADRYAGFILCDEAASGRVMETRTDQLVSDFSGTVSDIMKTVIAHETLLLRSADSRPWPDLSPELVLVELNFLGAATTYRAATATGCDAR